MQRCDPLFFVDELRAYTAPKDGLRASFPAAAAAAAADGAGRAGTAEVAALAAAAGGHPRTASTSAADVLARFHRAVTTATGSPPGGAPPAAGYRGGAVGGSGVGGRSAGAAAPPARNASGRFTSPAYASPAPPASNAPFPVAPPPPRSQPRPPARAPALATPSYGSGGASAAAPPGDGVFLDLPNAAEEHGGGAVDASGGLNAEMVQRCFEPERLSPGVGMVELLDGYALPPERAAPAAMVGTSAAHHQQPQQQHQQQHQQHRLDVATTGGRGSIFSAPPPSPLTLVETSSVDASAAVFPHPPFAPPAAQARSTSPTPLGLPPSSSPTPDGNAVATAAGGSPAANALRVFRGRFASQLSFLCSNDPLAAAVLKHWESTSGRLQIDSPGAARAFAALHAARESNIGGGGAVAAAAA